MNTTPFPFLSTKSRALLVLLSALGASVAHATVQLPVIFSDHMVLQSNASVPVWGWADPGEEVSVSIAGVSTTGKTGADGKWSVTLGKLKASSEPTAMVVTGTNTVTVNDVLIGEVWLASGQSNMALRMTRARDFETEKAAANFPAIRMFTVTRGATPGPRSDCTGKWDVCSPETVADFSAVAYFFGRELHQKLHAPVGIIHSSVGGTDIAAWTSGQAQAMVPELKAFLEKWEHDDDAFDAAKAKESYQKKLDDWQAAADKAKADGKTAPRKPAAPVAPHLSANYPAHLFNGYIAPLIPYAIRGAIWYQGEHNCSTIEQGLLYRIQLPLLIADWRTRWHTDFPFAWVQLPGYRNTGPGRAFVREAMLQTLKLKNTGMAVAIDIGDANDNHPKNKQDVGRRLALWALGEVYREKVAASSGPLPDGHQMHGSEIVVTFKHTENGLTAKDGDLKGFVMAGEDRRWKPAQARIDGEKVVVASPEVKKPVAVRYGWDTAPECNLYNGAGLPASPFRTDDWDQ